MFVSTNREFVIFGRIDGSHKQRIIDDFIKARVGWVEVDNLIWISQNDIVDIFSAGKKARKRNRPGVTIGKYYHEVWSYTCRSLHNFHQIIDFSSTQKCSG